MMQKVYKLRVGKKAGPSEFYILLEKLFYLPIFLTQLTERLVDRKKNIVSIKHLPRIPIQTSLGLTTSQGRNFS